MLFILNIRNSFHLVMDQQKCKEVEENKVIIILALMSGAVLTPAGLFFLGKQGSLHLFKQYRRIHDGSFHTLMHEQTEALLLSAKKKRTNNPCYKS